MLGTFILIGCGENGTSTKGVKSVYPNKFHNKELLQVYKYKDKRLTDELIRALGSEDHLIRQEAALALGSVLDNSSLPSLITALKDTVWQVRINAAFSVGQLRDSSATDALVSAYQKEPFSHVRLEMLHALGKFGSQQAVDLIDGYVATTKEDSLGIMWGYYRSALARPLNPMSISRIIGVLQTPHIWMRGIACNVLARSKGVDLTGYKDRIFEQLKNDPEPVVRMALCLALQDIDDDDVRTVLVDRAENDEDARVRINAVRALGSETHLKNSTDKIATLIDDPYHLVRIQVSQTLQTKLTDELAEELLAKMPSETNNWVKAQVYRACLSSPVQSETKERARLLVKETFEHSSDRYEKGCMIEALGGDPTSIEYLAEATFNAKEPVISTDGMGAIISIHRIAGRVSNSSMQTYYQRAFSSGDITMIGLAAGAIREMNIRNSALDTVFLAEVRDQLELPREVEAWIELQKTINHLTGSDEKVVAPASASPVDWEYIKKIPKSQKVKINTAKGAFILDLFVEEAPTSVGRFLQSIEDGFYDGKTFHRLVPNFVAQGGCPRGDGWGSPDWSLRSEFTLRHYKTGAVGLASAGHDTESCQFFFSHSPTLHLDGRYTLFGQVVEGMEVVQKLDLGDIIEHIELIPPQL